MRVLDQPVDQRMAELNVAGAVDCAELIGIETIEVISRLALDGDARVAEAEEGEGRPVALVAAALEHVFEPRLGRAHSCALSKLPSLVEDFGVLDDDPRAALRPRR